MISCICFQNEGRASVFRCEECGKVYDHKRSLARHKQSQHGGKTYYCSKCKNSFKRNDYKARHEKTCGGRDHVCPKCGKRCSTAYGLRRHLQWHEKRPRREMEIRRNESPYREQESTESNRRSGRQIRPKVRLPIDAVNVPTRSKTDTISTCTVCAVIIRSEAVYRDDRGAMTKTRG